MTSLEGRVALVTGSSRGIGAAIARRFAAAGGKLALHGRDAEALAVVQRDIEQQGGVSLPVLADVTRFEQIEAMRQQIERTLGPIDVLVTSAGGSFTMPGPFEEITEAGWHASVDGNLTATFLTLRAFLPRMIELRRGAIVTMASSAGRQAGLASPAYAAAKAGVVMLTGHLARELGPHGIRINCVAPSAIMNERLARAPEAVLRDLAASFPLRRIGTADDVAAATLYLASEASSWITGVTIDIAGGRIIV